MIQLYEQPSLSTVRNIHPQKQTKPAASPLLCIKAALSPTTQQARAKGTTIISCTPFMSSVRHKRRECSHPPTPKFNKTPFVYMRIEPFRATLVLVLFYRIHLQVVTPAIQGPVIWSHPCQQRLASLEPSCNAPQR